MLGAIRLAMALSASSVRVVQQPTPSHHTSHNAYTAAVAQTVFVDGPQCCPSPHPGRPGGCGCSGSEPICGLPDCQGTEKQIATRTKMSNVARFAAMVGTAAGKGADIIVFSEGVLGIAGYHYADKSGTKHSDGGGVASGGLAERIPDPRLSKAKIVPCDDAAAAAATPALHAFSCAAQLHKITVVLDMGDVQPCSAYPFSKSVVCSECPPEGVFRFNTQVAIGSGGELLAKYHKMHPYNPSAKAHCIGDGHQEPGLHDPRWFDTSFGVRFAMHLCYDIAFYTPAAQMAMDDSLNISNVVFSTHWENEEGPPISLGPAYFESYSRGHGLNLLAADAGIGFMHSGSGIFSHGDALAYDWKPGAANNEVLLIASVPKRPSNSANTPNRVDQAVVPWGAGPVSLAPPVWELLHVGLGANATGTKTLSGGASSNFSCTFSWSTKEKTVDSVYAAVALDGSYFGGGLPARSCAFYRVPPANLLPRKDKKGNAVPWVPWFLHGMTLYRSPNVTQAAEDVSSAGTPTFAALTIRGSFHSGDIVLPMLAAEDGAPMGKHVEVTESGRGMKITRPHQVTQAQLYLNTHEPDEIF